MDKTMKRFEVQIDADIFAAFDSKIDVPASKVARELVASIALLDKQNWQDIQRTIRGLDVPLSIFIKNCILAWIIRQSERVALLGSPDPGDILPMTARNGEGKFIDFEKYYRPAFRRQLELEVCEHLIRKEAFGIPLKNWEIDLLIKHHMGKAWLQSDEYKSWAKAEKDVKYRHLYEEALNAGNSQEADKVLDEWIKQEPQL